MKDWNKTERISITCKAIRMIPEKYNDNVIQRSDPESVTNRVARPTLGADYNNSNSKQKLCDEEEVGPKMLTQVLCCLVVASAHSGIGAVIGFSGVTLPQLTQPDNGDLYLSPSNAALYGSVISFGMAVGSLVCGRVIEKVGHCKTMLASLPISLAFWLLLFFSWNPAVVIISRTVLGLTTGVIYTTSISYTLEVTHKEHRGILFSITPVIRHSASLAVYSFGVTALSWRQMALICGIVTTVPVFVGLILFPESPRWLLTRGREEDALRSMIFFRGKTYDSPAEIKAIREQLNNNKHHERNQLHQLFHRPIINVFLMLSFVTFISTFNGSFAIIVYLVPIFQVVSSNVDAYTSAILVGTVRVIGTLLNLLLIDRLGRRPVHLSTYFIMSLAISLIGMYFYVQDMQWVVDNLSWVPLSSLLIYTLFMGIGQPVLIMMLGEILPTNVRATGVSILMFINFLGSFLVSQMFYVMEEVMGIYGTFWTYGGMSMFVFIFSMIFVPETSGLSLEEITDRM